MYRFGVESVSSGRRRTGLKGRFRLLADDGQRVGATIADVQCHGVRRIMATPLFKEITAEEKVFWIWAVWRAATLNNGAMNSSGSSKFSGGEGSIG